MKGASAPKQLVHEALPSEADEAAAEGGKRNELTDFTDNLVGRLVSDTKSLLAQFLQEVIQPARRPQAAARS
jgi:hypothetical protein